jgi:putative cell wall-binding protein
MLAAGHTSDRARSVNASKRVADPAKLRTVSFAYEKFVTKRFNGLCAGVHSARVFRCSWSVTEVEMNDTLGSVAGAVRHRSSACVKILVATSVLVTPLALTSDSLAGSVSGAHVQRLAGHDRYATAAQLSRETFSAGVPAAFVATGVTFPDGLAGAPAAAHSHGPVLLTKPGSLPDPTAQELSRLEPRRIVVLGGHGAVTDAVTEQLRSYTSGKVTRLSGANRYGTAAAVSKATFSPGVSTAFIATGQGFADALSGGAAAARRAGPVLLTKHGKLPVPTRQELRRLDPANIVILGGHGVVPDRVKTQLAAYTSGRVSRLSGHDRYATSVAVSKATFTPRNADVVYLATGTAFADALGGGAAAAHDGGPLLLSDSACLPKAVSNEIARLNPASVVLLGGSGALGPAVADLYTCATTNRTSVAPIDGHGKLLPAFAVTSTLTGGDCSRPSSLVGYAYRCFTDENLIIDPCWSGDSGPAYCLAGPFGRSVYRIELAAAPGSGHPYRPARVWGIEMASGLRCTLFGSGAHPWFHGRVVDYACSDNSTSVLRNLGHRGGQVTADLVKSTNGGLGYKSAGTAPVVKEVFGKPVCPSPDGDGACP